MYKKNKIETGNLQINQSYVGERIEIKVMRLMENKTPIKDGAPLMYEEREEGVNPACDPRTNKWDIAAEGGQVISMAHQAKRQARIDEKNKPTDTTGAAGNESKA